MIKYNLALDKTAAIAILGIGIIFIALLISMGSYNIAFPLVLLVSSLAYLIWTKRLLGSTESPQFYIGKRVRSLSHIIFIVSLTISIWLLWSNLYYRPPLYFILCLVAAGSIVLDILSLDETKSLHITFIFIKISALSLSIYAGIYYQFPGIYGVDPWWSNQWVQETIDLGYITPGQYVTNTYFLLPLFHLSAATMQIVSSISVYSSIFVTTGVMIAISCLFVFLIGRKLANVKIGLLAALITPLTYEAISRGTAIIPTSLSFCFFSALLYLVLCRDSRKFSNNLLILLFALCIVLTHKLATGIMLVSLIAMFIGIKYYNRIDKPTISHQLFSPIIIVAFGLISLLLWIRPSPDTPSIFTSVWDYLVEAWRGSTVVISTPTGIGSSSYTLFLLQRGGYLLLLGFGIIGALTYLRSDERTALKMALVAATATLIILPFVFHVFSLDAMLPWRWYLFQYVLLSILAMQGLLGICNLIRRNVMKLSMLLLVILATIFFMTTNGERSGQNALVFTGGNRAGYTESEITAIKSMSDMGCGIPIVDVYYNSIFSYVLDYDEYMNMIQGENETFVLRNYYLHYPEWNQNRSARLHPPAITATGPSVLSAPYVRISDYMEEHAIDTSPLIYNNGNVKVYATNATE